jgi:hypothetical protein
MAAGTRTTATTDKASKNNRNGHNHLNNLDSHRRLLHMSGNARRAA